jgi:hypothetical protein
VRGGRGDRENKGRNREHVIAIKQVRREGRWVAVVLGGAGGRARRRARESRLGRFRSLVA